MQLPGGGGYSDPLERAPDAVAADVARGLVSPERAREDYGVVGGFVNGTWLADAAATENERRERRNATGL